MKIVRSLKLLLSYNTMIENIVDTLLSLKDLALLSTLLEGLLLLSA